MASKVLTIEISNELVKLCEVTHQSNKSITVNRAVTVAVPENSVDDGMLKDVQALTEVIRSAINENAMTTKDVIMTILSTKIASKEAVIPYVKANKVGDIVRANATEYFPVNNIEDYSLTHTVLEVMDKDKDKSMRVLAMAAPNNIVGPYYDLAKRLGVNVVAMDYLGNSTLQMLKLQIDDAPSMVLQIGNDSTIINVMKNKVLQFQRTVPYGRSAVINAVMESKKLSYGVALELLGKGNIVHESFDGEEITESLRFLVNSISRIIDYYIARNQDSPIEKAYIMGDGASVIGIEKLFSNELNIEFEKLVDLKNVELDKFFRISRTELLQYISTMGACLAPVNFTVAGGKSKSAKANIPSASDATKYVIAFFAACVIVGVALVGYQFFRVQSLEKEKKNLDSKIKSLASAEDTYNAYIKSKAVRNDLEHCHTTLSAINNDYAYMLFVDLHKMLPSDVSLQTIQSINGDVSVSGFCRDKENLASTIMQLKKIDYVSDVHVSSGTETLSQDGIVTVAFEMTFKFTNPTDMMGVLTGEVEQDIPLPGMIGAETSEENNEENKEGN